MLIDTHAHLDSFKDYVDVVLRAEEQGVGLIISMSTSLKSSYKTVKIADEIKIVYAACGIHPHAAKEYSESVLREIKEVIKDSNKIVAVGETGLDYYYNNSERSKQIESFCAHIDLAKELCLPIVVHVRKANEDMFSILKGGNLGDRPGVIHCFSESYEIAKKYLDMDFYISFSGIVTFNGANEVREAAKKIPIDRLLVETDSPYLAPVPVRGKRNEPANVKYVADMVAQVRRLNLEALENQLYKNTLSLFSRLKPVDEN